MSSTSKLAIVLKIGEKFNGTFFIRNKRTKAAIDIENTLWKAGLKANINDAAELQAFTMSAPFFNVDEDRWEVSMTLAEPDISALTITEGAWDVFYSSDAGDTYQKAGRGSFTVEKKATNLS